MTQTNRGEIHIIQTGSRGGRVLDLAPVEAVLFPRGLRAAAARPRPGCSPWPCDRSPAPAPEAALRPRSRWWRWSLRTRCTWWWGCPEPGGRREGGLFTADHTNMVFFLLVSYKNIISRISMTQSDAVHMPGLWVALWHHYNLKPLLKLLIKLLLVQLWLLGLPLERRGYDIIENKIHQSSIFRFSHSSTWIQKYWIQPSKSPKAHAGIMDPSKSKSVWISCSLVWTITWLHIV